MMLQQWTNVVVHNGPFAPRTPLCFSGASGIYAQPVEVEYNVLQPIKMNMYNQDYCANEMNIMG